MEAVVATQMYEPEIDVRALEECLRTLIDSKPEPIASVASTTPTEPVDSLDPCDAISDDGGMDAASPTTSPTTSPITSYQNKTSC